MDPDERRLLVLIAHREVAHHFELNGYYSPRVVDQIDHEIAELREVVHS